MQRTSFAEMDCSIAQTLEIVGEWWTLLVIRDAFLGVRRFEEFQRSLSIARNVLTQRLERLVAHGIFERRLYQHGPDRYEYRLTEKGLDLYPILVAFIGWGDRWASDPHGPPFTLVHKSCGHEGTPSMVCHGCGEAVDPRAMSIQWKQGRPQPRIEPAADEPGWDGPEHSGTEHSGTEHSGTEHGGTEHSGTEHGGTEHGGTEHGSGSESTPESSGPERSWSSETVLSGGVLDGV